MSTPEQEENQIPQTVYPDREACITAVEMFRLRHRIEELQGWLLNILNRTQCKMGNTGEFFNNNSICHTIRRLDVMYTHYAKLEVKLGKSNFYLLDRSS